VGAIGFDWKLSWFWLRAEVAEMASLNPSQGINCRQ